MIAPMNYRPAQSGNVAPQLESVNSCCRFIENQPLIIIINPIMTKLPHVRGCYLCLYPLAGSLPCAIPITCIHSCSQSTSKWRGRGTSLGYPPSRCGGTGDWIDRLRDVQYQMEFDILVELANVVPLRTQ